MGTWEVAWCSECPWASPTPTVVSTAGLLCLPSLLKATSNGTDTAGLAQHGRAGKRMPVMGRTSKGARLLVCEDVASILPKEPEGGEESIGWRHGTPPTSVSALERDSCGGPLVSLLYTPCLLSLSAGGRGCNLLMFCTLLGMCPLCLIPPWLVWSRNSSKQVKYIAVIPVLYM